MTDLFGNEEKPKRLRSLRDEEHDAKISYRKYHSAGRVPCAECTKGSNGVRTATVVRREGTGEVYLCVRHAQEIRDREALGRG